MANRHTDELGRIVARLDKEESRRLITLLEWAYNNAMDLPRFAATAEITPSSICLFIDFFEQDRPNGEYSLVASNYERAKVNGPSKPVD